MFQNFYVNPVISNARPVRARVFPEMASPNSPGHRSALSIELDGLIDYDHLFDGLLELIAAKCETRHHQTVSEKEMHFVPIIDETEERGPQAVRADDLAILHTRVSHDRESGQIITVMQLGDEMITTRFDVLHREPLRLESWMEDGRSRVCDRRYATTIQKELNQIIEAQDRGWFW